MRTLLLTLGMVAASSSTGMAQTPATAPPSPGEIVAAAPASEWAAIAPSDLLVMDLAPDASGKARRIVIQLMPAPFSEGWVRNIRRLAAARWWDGTSVNRVQDNYVVQWGDATEKKPLPGGMEVMAEADYVSPRVAGAVLDRMIARTIRGAPDGNKEDVMGPNMADAYASGGMFLNGWPVALGSMHQGNAWPVHCYATVGVGRNLSPDTGSGAELYTVIGHAPRHLDRNIALVGRVIEGIEHLSSLPRGTGALGFYEKAEERVPILSVRIGTEISDIPQYQYLSSESESFFKYAEARANRRDPFFISPAGGADICNIPVPIRRAAQ
jgi:cyclophilin family peptidyl-prolyl cis-trans isomerase